MFDSREEFVLWYDVIVQVINMDVFEEDDLKEYLDSIFQFGFFLFCLSYLV